MGPKELFETKKFGCPSNTDNGRCEFQVRYNQHLNDPHYRECAMEKCPVFYWVRIAVSMLGDK